MEPGHIRLTDVAPPYCSACFGPKITERHVDFGAAWDGPVVPSLQHVVGVVGHTIDDLVICEECVIRAARLLGLTRNDELERQNAQLEAANSELHNRIDALTDQGAAVERVRAALLASGTPAIPAPGAAATPTIAPGPPAGARGRQKGTRKPKTKAGAR